jgi:hypothetical protein
MYGSAAKLCSNPQCKMMYRAVLTRCPFCGEGHEPSAPPKRAPVEGSDADPGDAQRDEAES